MNTTQPSEIRAELARPPMHTLVLHNAQDVSFQQVWAVLGRVFGRPILEIRALALQAHDQGTADLSTATQEVIASQRALCIEASRAEGCPQLPFSVREG